MNYGVNDPIFLVGFFAIITALVIYGLCSYFGIFHDSSEF